MDEREERDGGRGRKGKKGKKERGEQEREEEKEREEDTTNVYQRDDVNKSPPHTYTLSDNQLVISSAAAGDNQRSRYKQVGTYIPVS